MAPQKKSTSFTFFAATDYPSDDEDAGLSSQVTRPKPVGQRHSQVNNNSIPGNACQRCNVYMPSVPSPAKPAPPHRSESDSNWNTEPIIDFYELYPFADPSYQHAMDIMDPDVVPRRRTKSVSDYGSLTTMKLISACL